VNNEACSPVTFPPSDEGLILWPRSLIPGMFCRGSVCEDGPPSVEEILELHACSCGWKPWWRCGSGSASGRHQGIEALRTLPPHQSTLGCDHNPLLCSRNEQISACRGAFLTETREAGWFVGRFRSPLLQSADNASAALIPGQTARQRVLKVRPAEADQDPEAVDGCLVCSCCSPGYA
jgi:hypothetical protein